jgi:hypothetical protein
VLATTQITLSMALLAIAGLFIKSLVNVSRVELGMRTDNLITFNISPEMNGYTAQRSRQIFEQVEDELIRLPGVTDVTGGMVPLLSNDNWSSNVSVEGFKAGPDADSNSNVNEVAPAYFKTMGIPCWQAVSSRARMSSARRRSRS